MNIMESKYTVMDLFCGTGGFSNGFTKKNKLFEVIYALDIDPIAASTAKANHSNCLVESNDIRKLSPEVVSKKLGKNVVDVIIGGPPCQGFSSLRPYRSSTVEDERNNLYVSFESFVDFFRPKVVVMENVVGLVTHNSGQTLKKILKDFKNLGYYVDWKILNAAHYGVPQKRERFILIASQKNTPIRFPITTHYFSGRGIGTKDKQRHMLTDPNNPKSLSVMDAISDLPHLKSAQEKNKYEKKPKNQYQLQRRLGSSKLTLHKASDHGEKMLEVIKHSGDSIKCIPKHLITSGFSSCYSRLSKKEPATTITVKFQSPASSKCIHPTQNRTITPREAARIQSFDDSFIFKGSITQISSQIGNAVPPLLGKAISSSVSEILEQFNVKNNEILQSN
jgi:DNA (cytosine-5)-methyltransferase 1